MRIKQIPKDAVLIPGTIDDYVDPRGNIYGYNHRHGQECYPYRKELQKVQGYLYAPINYTSGRVTKRVHRIVAQAFIPNPNNMPIVLHIDNNKQNNHVENLKWGTIAENTKQAVDDKLLVNAKGQEDSQSLPCDMYETTTNKLLASFGSYGEAEKATDILVGTIRFQIQNMSPIRKKVYFTCANNGPRDHEIVVECDIITDKIINRFPNCGAASKETGIGESVISSQVRLGHKPAWSKTNTYFKRMYLKGEEVIEIEKRVE